MSKSAAEFGQFTVTFTLLVAPAPAPVATVNP